MPPQFFSHLTESSDKTSPTHYLPSTGVTILIFALSVLTLLGVLVPLFYLDFEVILFLRSFHFPILAKIGHIGDKVGNGTTLVMLSVGIGIVGYVWKRDHFKRAGWQSLIAHGVAGLIIQTIKILLGRPRPQFMHQDQWPIGPSLQSGLNTFPSGHSAASFAVAAVLARHFPKGAWIWYGAAGFVAISRIVSGYHFPSDALAGSLIGFLLGYILSHPLKDWRMSLLEGLVKSLPYWLGAFALIWVIFQYPGTSSLQVGMMGVGLTLIVVSIGVRESLILKPRQTTLGYRTRIQTANLMIWLGMALYTESLLVAGFALITGMAWWLRHSKIDSAENPGHQIVPDKDRNLAQEALLGVSLIALVIGIQQLKGLIPLQ